MNMRAPTPFSKHYEQDASPLLFLWQEEAATNASSPLEAWYQLTAPSIPSITATLAQRELVRRGRLVSAILLVMIAILLCVSPITFLPALHLAFLFPILLVSLVVICFALLLNRWGKITAAGLVVVIGISLGYAIVLITLPGGIGVNNVPTYDLLVESELLAVSLLPARSVFLVAGGNIVFIVADLLFQRHAPDLQHIIATNGYYSFIARPITLQIIVAVVTYLWVRSALNAIARADGAEEIAVLEHAIADQKQQLELGINQILETHVRVSNGDFTARAPLKQENVLWQIGISLNNLIARLQRLSQAEYQLKQLGIQNERMQLALRSTAENEQELQRTRDELQRTKVATAHLIEVLRQAKTKQHPIRSLQSGTLLDPLIQELAGNRFEK